LLDYLMKELVGCQLVEKYCPFFSAHYDVLVSRQDQQ